MEVDRPAPLTRAPFASMRETISPTRLWQVPLSASIAPQATHAPSAVRRGSSCRGGGRIQEICRFEVGPQARRDLDRCIADIGLDLLRLDRAQHDGDDGRMRHRKLQRSLADGDTMPAADLLDSLRSRYDRV